MIAAAAEALAVAHLCPGPDSLWRDARGELKITGLGIAAVLTGAPADDPALAGTRGLARLLYAALTGYWPGPEQADLPPAPRSGGRVPCPRQSRPGIPARIGAVTCRAPSGEACGDGPPIPGPAQLAMELATITRAGPPLMPALHIAPAPTLPLSPAAPVALLPAIDPEEDIEVTAGAGSLTIHAEQRSLRHLPQFRRSM
jgi:hypothetical protein